MVSRCFDDHDLARWTAGFSQQTGDGMGLVQRELTAARTETN